MQDAMVRLGKKSRPSRLIAFRTYLAAILACTFLLFSFNLISLVRQQNTVQDLSQVNLQASGDRIALELESRMNRLATDCLRSDQIESLLYSDADALSPERTQTLRRKFEDIKALHPIARHFFIFNKGRLVFPPFSLPGRSSEEDLWQTGTKDPKVAQYVSFSREAERAAIHPSQAEHSLVLYRQAERLDVPENLKALAAFYAARLLMRTGAEEAAASAFKKLAADYGDQYDQSQTPYALALPFSPDPSVSNAFRAYPLSRTYENLVSGRWNLTPEQVDYYLPRLEQRLGFSTKSRPDTDFMDEYALATVLQNSFRTQARELEDVTAQAISFKDKAYQTYVVGFPEKDGKDLIVGLAVSMPWIQRELLPECAETILGIHSVTPLLEEFHHAPAADANETSDLYVSLQNTLPFWRLRIPEAAIQESAAEANRELWFLGMSVGMFLCILALGVVMLFRVSRTLHWFTLRADFVSGISHELKTPLSLIRLYSETLADQEQEFSPEEQRSYTRIIAKESERLSRMIENILDFSRIEQGRRLYTMQEGDLAETVSQTLEDYSEYLAQRGFGVKTGFMPFMPPVRFNKEQVAQAVLNLMDNARKYSGQSRLIRVHIWMEEECVVLEVQDYGDGIPSEEQEKIFEPFYRGKAAGDKGGCGLGLYLVQHVMEAHGGKVEIQSEVGKGSRFRLHFPIAASAVKELRKQSGKVAARIHP